MNAIERMKRHYGLAADAEVGLIGSICKSVKVSPDSREIHVIATTDDIDMDREVVLPGGADLSYFGQNRFVFADHRYTVDAIVGRIKPNSLKLFPDADNPKGWRATITLPKDLPLADTVYRIAAHEDGGIGVSIGFEALDVSEPTDDEVKRYDPDGTKGLRSVVRKWRWLELSVTGLPANVAARGGAAKSGGTVDLAKMVTKGVISRREAEHLGLPAAPKRIIVV